MTDTSTEQKESPPETVEAAIARVEREVAHAKAHKDVAGIQLTARDSELAALTTLQRDSEKAKKAYAAVYDQLTIDRRSYQDFSTTEGENLEKRLGEEGKGEVTKKVEETEQKDKAAEKAVRDAQSKLDAAEKATKGPDDKHAAAAILVAQFKQLPAAIGAEHTKLKALQGEVLKARKEDHHALAYWLLTKKFCKVLDASKKLLVAPEVLKAKHLEAVKALAEAAEKKATADQAVADARIALADAKKADAEQKAKGEANLREQLLGLKPTPPAAPDAPAAPTAVHGRSDEENT